MPVALYPPKGVDPARIATDTASTAVAAAKIPSAPAPAPASPAVRAAKIPSIKQAPPIAQAPQAAPGQDDAYRQRLQQYKGMAPGQLRGMPREQQMLYAQDRARLQKRAMAPFGHVRGASHTEAYEEADNGVSGRIVGPENNEPQGKTTDEAIRTIDGMRLEQDDHMANY